MNQSHTHIGTKSMIGSSHIYVRPIAAVKGCDSWSNFDQNIPIFGYHQKEMISGDYQNGKKKVSLCLKK